MGMQWTSVLMGMSLLAVVAHGQTPDKPAAKQNKSAPSTQPAASDKVPLSDSDIPHEANGADFGKHLTRTMALLKAGQNGDPRPIRILFYGQSIAAQGKLQSTLVGELRRQYPKAKIISTSNAIGGYTAPLLVRVMVHDVVPVRPDLIIFDDYDGEKDGNYDQIIHYLRSHTTAEILTWSPHVDNYGPENDNRREVTSVFRRNIAAKYDSEFADVRGVWKQYLQQHDLPRTALLTDKIHNTPGGCELMAKILLRHFVQPSALTPAVATVKTIPLAEASGSSGNGIKITGSFKPLADGRGIQLDPNSTLELEFTGSRVDVIGEPSTVPASARILIDGKAPSEWPQLWIASRPSAGPVGWFPGVNRVSMGSTPAVREKWNLHVYATTKDASDPKANYTFKYRLTGSVTGPDGEGDSSADFVSNSKRIQLLKSDFSFNFASRVLNTPLPTEFDVHWETRPLCLDEYHSNSDAAKTEANYQTVVNGLSNQTHHLKIVADGNTPLPIRALEVHRPEYPAKEEH